MKKNLLTIGLLSLGFASQAQTVYVGDAAAVTVQDQSLVYDGGGWQNAGTGAVSNTGDIMVVGTSSDAVSLAAASDFHLNFSDTSTYGQVYISGIPQGNISGSIKKDYKSDANHASDYSRQNLALPFYNYTAGNLISDLAYAGTINITNNALTGTAGRYNVGSVLKWSNAYTRFDQIIGDNNTVMGHATDYYAIPRRTQNAGGTVTNEWNTQAAMKTFKGLAVTDNTSETQVALTGASNGISFGTNGSSKNYYNQKYSTYVVDPFSSTSPSWAADYGKNLYQLGNPFLTNIDLSHIAANEVNGDGLYLVGVTGLAVQNTGGFTWSTATGNTFSGSPFKKLTVNSTTGLFEAGDVNDAVVKPLGVFFIKTDGSAVGTLNLDKTRRFAQSYRSDFSSAYSVAAAKGTKANSHTQNRDLASPSAVKQVAVVLKDAAGKELGRTYYAVSGNAVSGFSTVNPLQAYVDSSPIYTSEELVTGGADTAYSNKLYINAANEVNFAGKEIPMLIDSPDATSITFELYQGGERVNTGANLANGKSFYISKNNVMTQITDSATMPVGGSTSFSLYYELPSTTLATADVVKSQTVIAKKDTEWVVRFARDWKDATVEVYSGSGQLINISKNVNTSSDFVIPMSVPNGFYLVKAINNNGETVIKKIIK